MTTVTTLTGGTVTLDRAFDDLGRAVDGDLLGPHSDAYDEARGLWNGMIERRPGLIVRCVNATDVQQAVRYAAAHELLVAVCGGGHNVAAGVDGGLVIDLSAMRDVEVDPQAARAHAGGGATWAQLDAATQTHGLATAGGVVSDTGIGGLTLGGGIGWLRRKHGLSCDNLVAAQVVTADGEVREVDEQADPELLWALRGGGGNFGVVTRSPTTCTPWDPTWLSRSCCTTPTAPARSCTRTASTRPI